jgi:quercetin dioxygenase-like cupin family protein
MEPESHEGRTIAAPTEEIQLMSSISSTPAAAGDEFWWQGSRMRIKARAADTNGALGLVEGSFYQGFGPPLHTHRREQEGMLVLEGQIRFRQGDEDFVAGPGTLSWVPPGVPHAFKVVSENARALVIVTPGGFEQMFADGGVPASAASEPPVQRYDPEAARALAERYGFDVLGPQLD